MEGKGIKEVKLKLKKLDIKVVKFEYVLKGVQDTLTTARDFKVPKVWESYFKSGRFEEELNALARAIAITSNIKIMDYREVEEFAEKLGISSPS